MNNIHNKKRPPISFDEDLLSNTVNRQDSKNTPDLFNTITCEDDKDEDNIRKKMEDMGLGRY